MNTKERIKIMEDLKWKGVSSWYQNMLNQNVNFEGMECLTFFDNLLNIADIHQGQRKFDLMLKKSRLPRRIIPADVQCSAANGLSKEKWAYLCECNFIDNRTSMIITGKTGVGKTYTSLALGYQACSLGKSTLFYNMSRLQDAINHTQLQGTYYKLVKQLTKVSLLIIDDFALVPISQNMLISLYDIMEARNGVASTIITSQLPFNNWYGLLHENLNLGEAFLDRLKGSSENIELKGKSRRNFKNPSE